MYAVGAKGGGGGLPFTKRISEFNKRERGLLKRYVNSEKNGGKRRYSYIIKGLVFLPSANAFILDESMFFAW